MTTDDRAGTRSADIATQDKIVAHFRGGVIVLATYYLAHLTPEQREAMRGRTFGVSVMAGEPFKVALIDENDQVLLVLPEELPKAN